MCPVLTIIYLTVCMLPHIDKLKLLQLKRMEHVKSHLIHQLDLQPTRLGPVETSLQTAPLETTGSNLTTRVVPSESTVIWMDQLVAVGVTQRKEGG